MNLNTQNAIETDEKNYDHHSLRDRTDTLESGELTSCIRYAAAKSDRDPRLTPISKAIPDHARFLGPVYHLTEDQLDRQHEDNLKNPYAIHGEKSIAKELSDEAEIDDRADYPVFAESDDIGDKGRYEVYEAMHDAIPEIFGVAPEDCSWYFSGRRSIHIHLPLVARRSEQLSKIWTIVEDYNEGAEVTLDPTIYKRKNLFRLPGAVHEETGYPKVRLKPNYKETELSKRLVDAARGNVSRTSVTGKELIQDSGITPSIDSTTTAPHYRPRPHTTLAARTPVLEVLSSDSDSPEIEPDSPLIKKEEITPAEREEKPTDDSEKRIWCRHQGQYFSPYAKARERSVVVFTVKGSPFCNRDEKGRALIPSHVRGGIAGGFDDTFEYKEQSAPVYLSEIDYRKYEERSIEQGDTVLLIGGRSRKSKIIKIEDHVLAREIASILRDQGRNKALELLESEGIDVGSSGKVTGNYENIGSTGSAGSTGNESTEAGELKRAVENGKLHVEDDLSHPDRHKILWRLLHIEGIDEAVEWFQEAYGPEYSEKTTWKHVKKEAKRHPHIEGPIVKEESF
jgi:hypothetical protein